MKTGLAFGVVMLSAVAGADVLPPPPDDPLGPDCQPFIGVWAQSTPDESRGRRAWRIIAVGAERATVTKYVNLQDVNVTADSADAWLSCDAMADGTTRLTFKATNDKFILAARLTGEASFTTESRASYLEPGPPPDSWDGGMVVTTWVRIAR